MQVVNLNSEAEGHFRDAVKSLQLAREAMELLPECTCREDGPACNFCRVMAFLDQLAGRLDFMSTGAAGAYCTLNRRAGSS